MKFKIFNKNLDRYVAPDEWFVNGDGDIFVHDMMDGELVRCNKEDYIIYKFTELYDIYSTPIYEGDLVKLHFTHENIQGETYTVKYKSGRWMLDDYDSLSKYWVDNKSWGDCCKVLVVS